MKFALRGLCGVVIICSGLAQQAAPSLVLNDLEYFELPGLNVMVFQDIYPEGHQAGVSIIQNGERVATNGDIRLEPTPGQWQPMPKQLKRIVSKELNEITAQLAYPDADRNRKGFNPIDYPDLSFSYQVRVRGEGQSFRIFVDLDQPLPAEWVGKVGFNFELYPTVLFGRSWYLGEKSGIFPQQANGPTVRTTDGEFQPGALASGKRLTIAPESDSQRVIIESQRASLFLYDGRNKHNNGWFVVRSLVPPGATKGAIEWLVTPNVIPGWKYKPVIHVSQIGYHPRQSKVAIVEVDASDQDIKKVSVKRVLETGGLQEALAGDPKAWGKFLRYKYLTFDFTALNEDGMYVAEYGDTRTEPFKIGSDVFQNRVWQPTLEYFLPAQMCHMRVNEQYRVWHGLCHMDDALMAPINHNHFDGYLQGASTLTRHQSGDAVPGLNAGGWHDAGDYDLRVESQADEVAILGLAVEAFRLNYDETTVDQKNRVVEIHQPDGKSDLLQQVEHGVLSILGGYKNLGRLYRGIICPTLRQYVLLGDGVNMTDGLTYDAKLAPEEKTATHSGRKDDRLVFTEQNSGHEYKAIAALAIAGRVLKGYDDQLATECTAAAEALWLEEREVRRGIRDKVTAAVELFRTTRKPAYRRFLLDSRKEIVGGIGGMGWVIGPVLPLLEDSSFTEEVRTAVKAQFAQVQKQQQENPFGVPYRPYIWGAGWGIQRFGVEQYFLHKAFPDIVSTDYMLNALNFVLGAHPGPNTASFASGVGARSMTTAYGINRADWSYIPGGVVSGTALIRPDFPEMKNFPYLWQQTEYVLGGGATNFMFLVLAADQVLNGK
ncbi:MAG: glycoside hydrolase [Acidobacteria bacterium]|nr:MAG: glycoside hydrolase [Acidobacteriota bacterium]